MPSGKRPPAELEIAPRFASEDVRLRLCWALPLSQRNSECIIPLAEIFMTDAMDELPGPPPIICDNDPVLLEYAVLNGERQSRWL